MRTLSRAAFGIALSVAIAGVGLPVASASPAASTVAGVAEVAGTPWSWGYNTYGQLGDGTTEDHSRPAPVVGLDDVVALSAGTYHTLALRADGTVWAWGANDRGQLGNGHLVARSTPSQVVGLDDVVQIDAGHEHSLALRSDGTVWAWGDNDSGQLGVRDGKFRTTPGQVPDVADVTAISVGTAHNLVLRADGTVWAWGYGGYGQLGTGDYPFHRPEPKRVQRLRGVVAVAAGGIHSVALLDDGTVRSWGTNQFGALGIGQSPGYAGSPVVVPDLDGVTALRVDGFSNFAQLSDGTWTMWGDNYYGQLGDGTKAPKFTPTPATHLDGMVDVRTDGHFTLSLDAGGAVWAWGDNDAGQLGDGTRKTRLVPGLVPGLTGVVAIEPGYGRGHVLIP